MDTGELAKGHARISTSVHQPLVQHSYMRKKLESFSSVITKAAVSFQY